MRRARVNITLPDDLAKSAKAAGLNISQLARTALREELDRRDKVAALDAYLAELDAELGPPTAEEDAEADAWADRVFGAQVDRRSVVAFADRPGGSVVLTSDPADLRALAAHAVNPVSVERC